MTEKKRSLVYHFFFAHKIHTHKKTHKHWRWQSQSIVIILQVNKNGCLFLVLKLLFFFSVVVGVKFVRSKIMSNAARVEHTTNSHELFLIENPTEKVWSVKDWPNTKKQRSKPREWWNMICQNIGLLQRLCLSEMPNSAQKKIVFFLSLLGWFCSWYILTLFSPTLEWQMWYVFCQIYLQILYIIYLHEDGMQTTIYTENE